MQRPPARGSARRRASPACVDVVSRVLRVRGRGVLFLWLFACLLGYAAYGALVASLVSESV
jgi:hypothetical protein